MLHYVQIRRRLHVQRAKTLGSYPANAVPSDHSPTESTLLSRPSTAAVGLDCFELFRRSRTPRSAVATTSNSARSSRRFLSNSPPLPDDDEFSARSPSGGGASKNRRVVRRIQSLNRYTRNRDACQLSWESLQTKPPRPPTAPTHPIVVPHSDTIDVVPPGRVAEMVNQVEARLTHHKQQERSREYKRASRFASKSFDQATVRRTQLNQVHE